MKKNICIIIFLLAVVSTFGCASIPMLRDRLSVADELAGKAGFKKEYFRAGDFTLLTYQRFTGHSDSINIYIEGDGRAWETKHKLSDDPTPSNPIALRLAVADSAENIAYIARPGQYSASGFPECDPKYWSGSRFAPEVINSFNRAIDILKEKSGVNNVMLVGYSGGGAVAVLVAAGRGDVVALRTVAGNLNSEALSTYHHVTQLGGSMNPLDVAYKVAHIPQRHFVGSRDKIVPFAIVESFVKMEKGENCKCITVVEGVSHNGDWGKRWKELLLIPL